MTWKELKLYTLQKMFSASGSDIVEDESTKDYLAAMPQAANEALAMCATAGKFITKRVTVANTAQENLILEDTRKVMRYRGEEKSYSTSGAKAYTFEVCGTAIVKVYSQETLIKTYTIQTDEFETFGEVVADADELTILFGGEYGYMYKNVAFYAEKSQSNAAVPSWAKQQRVNLKQLVSDFYSLTPENVIFEGDQESQVYTEAKSFWFEGDGIFVYDRDLAGIYTLYYNAYPEVITTATQDNYELLIDAEIAAMLPLYMASQIYKDDDLAAATVYRNEFETAFERLGQRNPAPQNEAFVSESGWI